MENIGENKSIWDKLKGIFSRGEQLFNAQVLMPAKQKVDEIRQGNTVASTIMNEVEKFVNDRVDMLRGGKDYLKGRIDQTKDYAEALREGKVSDFAKDFIEDRANESANFAKFGVDIVGKVVENNGMGDLIEEKAKQPQEYVDALREGRITDFAKDFAGDKVKGIFDLTTIGMGKRLIDKVIENYKEGGVQGLLKNYTLPGLLGTTSRQFTENKGKENEGQQNEDVGRLF